MRPFLAALALQPDLAMSAVSEWLGTNETRPFFILAVTALTRLLRSLASSSLILFCCLFLLCDEPSFDDGLIFFFLFCSLQSAAIYMATK